MKTSFAIPFSVRFLPNDIFERSCLRSLCRIVPAFCRGFLGDNASSYRSTQTGKEKAYLQAWYMVPSSFYPKYLLAKLYDENCQPQKAKTIAMEIMEKEMKVEPMAIEEIRAEMAVIINKSSSYILIYF